MLSMRTVAILMEIEQRCKADNEAHVTKMMKVMQKKLPGYAIPLAYSMADWNRARREVLGIETKDGVGFPRGREKKSGRALWGVVRRTVKNRFLFEMAPRCTVRVNDGNDDDTLCEFYNVLWVERKDGVAYRRACGWVSKAVWEANATAPVGVKLG